MFWLVLIIIIAVFIIIDIYKFFSRTVDSIGKNLGLSKKQTNLLFDLWAIFDMEKNKKQ